MASIPGLPDTSCTAAWASARLLARRTRRPPSLTASGLGTARRSSAPPRCPAAWPTRSTGPWQVLLPPGFAATRRVPLPVTPTRPRPAGRTSGRGQAPRTHQDLTARVTAKLTAKVTAHQKRPHSCPLPSKTAHSEPLTWAGLIEWHAGARGAGALLELDRRLDQHGPTWMAHGQTSMAKTPYLCRLQRRELDLRTAEISPWWSRFVGTPTRIC